MKKLLSLISVSGILASSSATVVSAINSDKTLHKNLNIEDISNSDYLARGLIMKSSDDYSYSSSLKIASQNDNSMVSSWNNTFGLGNYNNGNFVNVDKGSKDINYQADGVNTLTDQNSVIGNIKINGASFSADEMLSLLKTLMDSQGSANAWINSILGGNLIQFVNSLGTLISNTMGKNNTLSQLLKLVLSNNVFIQQFINIFSTNGMQEYNSTFANKKFATFNNDGSLNINSAFGMVNNNINITFANIIAGQDFSVTDFSNISNYILLVLNYISQFNYSSTGKIGKNLFDVNISNDKYLENINNQKIKPINSILNVVNLSNLNSLITNISNYKNNDGLAFGQLIYVLTGDANNITDNNKKISIADLSLIPTSGSKNPLNKTLGTGLNFVVAELINNENKNVIFHILNRTNLGEQILQLISSLLSDIVQNYKIDLPLDYIDEMATLFQNVTSLIPNTDQSKLFTSAIKISGIDINDLVNKILTIIPQIKSNSNITNSEDAFSPSGYNANGNDWNISYDINVQNITQSDNVSIWNNIWTNNYDTTPVIGTLINSILGTKMTSLSDVISNFMDDKIFGTTISSIFSNLNTIIDTINKYNSEIGTIINAIGDFVEKIYNSLISSDAINNAKTIYNQILTAKGKQDTEVNSLIGKNPSLISYISAISLADSKKEIDTNILNKYSTTINNVVLNLLRNEPINSDSGTVKTGSFIDIFDGYYATVKNFVDSNAFLTIFNTLRNAEEAPFLKGFNNFNIEINPDITATNINNSYEYSYQMSYNDIKTNEITKYLIKLDEQNTNITDINSIYYKMTILPIV